MRLGFKYGMSVAIVDLVEQQKERSHLLAGQLGSGGASPSEKAGYDTDRDDDADPAMVVSSTEVREMLLRGDVKGAARLLGRHYRLIAAVECRFGTGGAATVRMTAEQSEQEGSAERSEQEGGGSAEHPDCSSSGFVVPSAALLNMCPASGGYRAAVTIVNRTAGDAEAGPSSSTPSTLSSPRPQPLLQTLPLDLKSGTGLPIRVRIGPEGIAEEGVGGVLASAITAAAVHRGVSSNGSSDADKVQHFFVVLDFLE